MRKLLIIGTIILGIGLFYIPLYDLIVLALQEPLLSHTMLIPLVSLYVFWVERKTIFSDLTFSHYNGAGLMVVGLLFVSVQKYRLNYLNQTDSLSVLIACMVVWIWGGFLLTCGRQSFKKALFPLLFLAFMIPLPSPVLEPMVEFLQAGSAWSTKMILRLLSVPAYTEGVFITLSGVTVEVAKECSGIRSGMALVILSTFAGYMYLKSNRRRALLVLCVIPISIVKNGMRIATLAMLGNYVDMHFLTNSALHRYGGKPFFLVAIAMIAPIFWILKRSEKIAEKRNSAAKGKSPLCKDMEISEETRLSS